MSFLDRFRQDETDLDEALKEAYSDLKGRDYESDEAQKIIARIAELTALKKKRVSPDTLMTVGGNVGIAILILAFEKHHVLTTKMSAFLVKPR